MKKIKKWIIGMFVSLAPLIAILLFFLIIISVVVSSFIALASWTAAQEEVSNDSLYCSVENIPKESEVIAAQNGKIIKKYMKEYKIDDKYYDLLFAQMAQESGMDKTVLENDPFQAAESLGMKPGELHDNDKSIKQAMMIFAKLMKITEDYNIAMPREEAALQGYNFNGGSSGDSHGYLYYLKGTADKKHDETKSKAYAIKTFGVQGNGDPAGGDYKYISHIKARMGSCSIIDGGLPMKAGTYTITQRWGDIDCGINLSADCMHKGTDLDGGDGAGVYSVADGEVLMAGKNIYDDAQIVYIKHSDNLYTVYMHLQKGSIPVKKGQKVKKGQQIGKQGATGHVTGSHLHFEVRTSDNYTTAVFATVDPQKFFALDENQRK